MSKRLAENEEGYSLRAKRVRSSQKEGHIDECDDPDCEGCDVGEIEISFIRTDDSGNEVSAVPSAQELLDMAIQEASADKPQEDLIRRLFDLALEQFKDKEPDNRVGYATCLIELGRAINVEESLREGLDILRGISKKGPVEDPGVQGLITVRAALGLAIALRKRQNALFEEVLEEDEEPDQETLNKQYVKKDEAKLYKEAIDAMDMALPSLDKMPSKQARSALNDFHAYVQLLDQPFHNEHIISITDALERYMKYFAYDDDADLQALRAATLLHKQKFVEDPAEQQALCTEIEKVITRANNIYKKKYQKEFPRGWELLAMLQLTQSNLLEDDDEVLAKYDQAIESFKKALELNPDNEDLKDMVDMLLGEDDQ
ncbi:hypothetical protein BX666DRAFT_2029310 [Dichotomocladium elegans]|nr:hypothetical protein BX666DRAFT_2029310 [Dichotomocladium elegans]